MSASSFTPDGTDVSVFIGSEAPGINDDIQKPQSGPAGAAVAGSGAAEPATAVYFNPAYQAKQEPHSSIPQATKTVYLIRHGEGWHNIGYDHNLDPHLTPRGWAQTAALQQHLAALQPQLGIELVVVSPLRRTLETAAGVFGAASPPPMQAAAAAANENQRWDPSNPAQLTDSGWVLMKPQYNKPNEITHRAMIYLPPIAGAAAAAAVAAAANGSSNGSAGGEGSSSNTNGVHRPLPIVAIEGCRERIGPNVCDKFRDISLQISDFPGVDFSLMVHQQDVNWERFHAAVCQDGGCYFTGEEETACERRALEFYQWLMSRPEQRIAVVSHCGFLCHGMRALGKSMLQTWNEAMLQQCNIQTAAKVAALGSFEPEGNNDSTASPLDLATAEAVRVSAGDVAGRMSTDWMNCEMRSVQLCCGPELIKRSSNGVAGEFDTAATGGLIDSRRWLWASAGDGAAWFPGGFYGL